MALSQKLALRQSQSLVMTPQLSQSIKLLTMSNIELAQFIESELEKNPFLEVEKPRAGREETQSPPPNAANEGRTELDLDVPLNTDAESMRENLGTDIENTFPDDPSLQAKPDVSGGQEERFQLAPGGLRTSTAKSADDIALCELTPQHQTLADHLHGQLAIAAASKHLHAIAAHIIDLLDETGYLRDDIDQIASRLSVSTEEVQAGLELVQTLEPVGVGARDLAECLSLQLADRGRLDPAIQTVIDNLDLLARRDFATLEKLSGLEIEDLTDVLQEIRELEPRPGTLFSDAAVAEISPDIIVSEAQDGSWRIELNNETLPRVLVDNAYVSEVSKRIDDGKDREFLTNCLQNANWLTKSLDQRAQTILKVATEIMKRQDSFMVEGVRALKPLTLQMVADEIGMHESSVSRVTTGKYMLTPRGMFELKYFFTSAIAATEDGETHSSEAVRDRIRGLIEAETARSVLSDDAIVNTLENAGIKIARRTVAKYRDSMQIPSSVQRRREKQALEKAARQELA